MIHVVYKTSCIPKKVIKKFVDNEIIKNTYNNELFRIKIYSRSKYEFNSHCISFLSMSDKKCGIFIFATGTGFTKEMLLTKSFKGIFQQYLTYVTSFITNNKLNKLLICGHSMGNFLSQKIGYELLKNEKYSSLDIFIIGSAGISWLNDDIKDHFNDLTRGKILNFCNSNTYINDDKQQLYTVFDERYIKNSKYKGYDLNTFKVLMLNRIYITSNSIITRGNLVNTIFKESNENSPPPLNILHQVFNDVIEFNFDDYTLIYPEDSLTRSSKLHQWLLYLLNLKKILINYIDI